MSDLALLRAWRPEHVARALLSLAGRLIDRLAEPMAYGDIDPDERRRRALSVISDVRAIAEGRPLATEDRYLPGDAPIVDAHATALARMRAMLPDVSDAEISRACEDEARRSDKALADCERWMASLRPAPRRARESQPINTARSVEISDLLGGDDPDARARGDLAIAGFDAVEGDPGWDAVQDTGDRVVTLSTGHGSESEAWAWLRRWVADRDAAPQPLDTSPG